MIDRRIQKEREDCLADFADHLLAGEIKQDAVVHDLDPELTEMKKTLRQVWQTLPDQGIDPAMQNRIRSRLTAEWRRNNSPVRNMKKRSFFSSGTWGFAFGISAVAIILLLVTFLPTEQTTLSGAAGTGSFWIPLAILIIVIAMLIFWQLRKK